MALATDQLKEKVLGLPSQLRGVLERQAKAMIAIARLESAVEEHKAHIKLQDDAEGINDVPDHDFPIIKLESKVESLKLDLSEAEDKAEMAFRSRESKVTEGYVKAAIGCDPVVSRLRHELLDAKEAVRIGKATSQSEKLARVEADNQAWRLRENAITVDDRLLDLESKLAVAKEELILAQVEVSVIESTIETYRILADL